MKKVTDVLLRHPQVHVLTDDIYEHLVYGGLQIRHAGRRSSRISSTAR